MSEQRTLHNDPHPSAADVTFPSGCIMSSRPCRKGDVKLKENVPVQAVVVVDDFDGYFEPLTWTRSKGMVPLLNRPLVDHTLRFLLVRGVQETFVFCSRHHDVVSSHVRQNWASSKMDVHVIVSETYNSLGDVMRDVDRQAKIKSDFILIHGDVVGNINLLALLDEHRCVFCRYFCPCLDDDLITASAETGIRDH